MQRILTKREKKILYITVAVIISAVSFNFFSETVFKKNDALNKEIVLTKGKLKKYARLLANKEVIQNKYSKFASSAGLSKNTLVSLLAEIEAIAKEADIRIIDLRPQGQKESDLSREALIDLRTEGAIEDYLKFIYDIENSLSLFRIKRIQLNAKPNSQTLEGSFSIVRPDLF